MKVPYAGRVYDKEEIRNLIKASKEFWLTEGKWSEMFSKGLCDFLGMRYCVLCNSGSSANLLAITALELPRGSEVFLPACGFPTTLNPIIQNNLIPIFTDIKFGSWIMDDFLLEGCISENTKAIVVPHNLGNPSNMHEIVRIAKKYDLKIVEDNCDALGSRYGGTLTGTFGDMSTLSFYPSHHITTGEGGAVLTNNYEYYKRLISYRDWGRDCICKTGHDNTCGNRFGQQFGELPYGYDHKYVYSRIGYNLKMTDLQASIGVAQLKKLPKFIKQRKHNFERLYCALKKYEELTLPIPNGDPAWFGFPIYTNDMLPRNKIVEYLENRGIATRMLFGGNLTKQPAYKDVEYSQVNQFHNTDLALNGVFWVGVYPGINKEKMDYMIRKFHNFMNNFREGK